MILRLVGASALCVLGSAPLATATPQGTCTIEVDCGPDATAGSQGPFQDSFGPAIAPFGAQSLSVPKFDIQAAAALHGVEPGMVVLTGVELTVSTIISDADVLYDNSNPNAGCDFDWDYLIQAGVLPNTSLGTPEVLASINLSDSVSIPANGNPAPPWDYSWNLITDGPGVSSNFECLLASTNLGAWSGAPGELITFGVSSSAVDADNSACGGLQKSYINQASVEVSVRYVYCYDSGPPPTSSCVEGCTPGYWKTHPERWDGQGGDDFTSTVTATDSFNAAFGVTQAFSGFPDTVSLIDAAGTGGGGLNALARHAAAALANSDTAILYPYDTATVISIYRDGVGADAGPETVESAKDLLESANEAGCPLSNDYQGAKVCPYCDANLSNDCPCGAPVGTGGCTNSTGQGALLQAAGSSNYGADDLVLSASGMPAAVSCVWIAAPAQQRVVLGDGLLCLANGTGKIIRRQVGVTSSQGTSQFGPGIVAGSLSHPVPLAAISPGDVWYFQLFYRDPASTCGAGTNLSNALEVTFYP